ncbi:hypothetical protein [Thermodesulfovibrio yellowstonii]|uniref:Methionine synthase n=1 Tax=Thermodesulfovibrio yellowstonii TaxID=28262 RepID=A0A9W6GHV4_9BACT|nr:hypothetical protein [Thermodesulfovibrio islandicus]GLI54255.1 hypothetical protein TISLANDTSLP1_19480 [Thermodesulfovibrio islandicus]
MFEPFSTTGIGSMPHTEVLSACELILKYFDIPFWPQMPKYSQNEQMITQFCEGLPGITLSSGKVYIKRDEELITEWLSNYHEDIFSPISKEYAIGLYRITELINGKKLKIFKGQITGPVTFTLSLKDEEGKIIYFDETLRELALMHLKAKAKWQIDFLKNFAEKIIIFIDEPILQAVGTSAYISVEQSEAIRLIKELVSFIKSLGVRVGIHCCGRTDWKEILSIDIDVLSFDAFSFFDFFKIYRDEITEFITKNGYIAWGFIPTTDDLNALSDEEIVEQAVRKIEEISKILPSITQNSIITPSCGMGSLDILSSERVCKLLKKLKIKLTNE